MNTFMNENYLLKNNKAIELYQIANKMPIFDYHCHLSPKEIFENKRYNNLTELWLLGDHYKWRLMRQYGIQEKYITGDANDKDKFFAFCDALPSFIGHPVYQWAHLELKMYFGITIPICKKNAEDIWFTTQEYLKNNNICPLNLIIKSNVKKIVTTDDPIDNLEYHKLIANEVKEFVVLPSFRTDRLINITKSDFSSYIDMLSKSSNTQINSIDNLLLAVERRIEYFSSFNCSAADCSFDDFPNGSMNIDIVNDALFKAMKGDKISLIEQQEYSFYLLVKLGELFKKYNIVMQLHTAVIRNQYTNRFATLGADIGNDSVANSININNASKLLDTISTSSGLPKTIIYTLNPNAYYALSTLMGDFAENERGKLQLGAAWWFMDHRDGIIEQLRHFAVTNGLGLFNGMLTDSRSFTSYARHDYFRRILCNIIGEWVEDGEYPDDKEMLTKLVEDICYNNAINYFKEV